MATVFYFDDALSSERQSLEKTTLSFLQGSIKGSTIKGFGTDREVLRYFFNLNNPLPDVLVLDHNLYWHRDESFPYGYEFRYSYQLMQELDLIRYGQGVLTLPKIIYSDDDMAESFFRGFQIPYDRFVPKWGTNPWIKLTEEVEILLKPPLPIERR